MDKYTKFILSVIALSLVWISLHLGTAVSTGYAAYADTKIEIVDISVGKHRALPVHVTGELKCSN